MTVSLLASLTACGGSETDVAPTPTVAPTTTLAPTTTVDDQAVAVTEEDLVYATWAEAPLTLDMHAPAKPADAPIVIYLPGRARDSAPPWIVRALVDEGALVFVVRYAASNSPPEQTLADHGADARAQSQSVACAIHYARAQASNFGNNDPLVVLTGFSRGSSLGTHAALFGATLEARWDEYAAQGGPPRQVECEIADGSTHVDAVVGMSGDHDVFTPIYKGKYGRAYQQERDPELWELLSSSIGASPNLKIRLIHGTSDYIPVEDAAEFTALLTDAGYDVELTTFEGGHATAPLEILLPRVVEVLGQ